MILTIPAFIKILVVFSFILALNRYKVPLYVCLLSAAAAVGLWMGHPPKETIHLMLIKSFSEESLWLTLIIVEIIVLSHLLAEGRQMERIVDTFKNISFGNRFTLASLPALIGLLPMPGGALFSAPMVESSAEKNDLSPELKTAINYWFRHVWEYWWPLYPGIILAISMLEVAPWVLIVTQFPLCLGVLISGVLFLLSRCPKEKTRTNPSWNEWKKFLFEIVPFGIVIFTMLLLNAVTQSIELPFVWSKYLNFLMGIILAQWWVIKTNGLSIRLIREAHFSWSTFNMAMIILGIMAFKGVLIESHIIDEIQKELINYHIPITLVVALLPFIAGLVTGIAIGFVGSSYPLIIALLHGQVHGNEILAYSILAYGFGYMGMMMSPVHLCFLVTKDYFHADFFGAYKLLMKPIIFTLIWTTFLFLFGRMVLT
ncbi:MAG: DUF401 family protein [Thermodesulfobacteriota bacterium]|nr:DUF401 family protein [Thermodesulfobacteriota bacterium]